MKERLIAIIERDDQKQSPLPAMTIVSVRKLTLLGRIKEAIVGLFWKDSRYDNTVTMEPGLAFVVSKKAYADLTGRKEVQSVLLESGNPAIGTVLCPSEDEVEDSIWEGGHYAQAHVRS